MSYTPLLVAAVNNDDTGTVGFATSVDGFTWTTHPGPTGGYYVFDVSYSVKLGMFLAIDGIARLWTSIDGVTWALRGTAPRTYSYLDYSTELDAFIGVAGAYVGLSDDGVTWTEQRLTPTLYGSPVWVAHLQKFAAPAKTSAYGVATSIDGVTWSFAIVNYSVQFVGIAASDSLLMMVGHDSLPRIYTSTDGVTWAAGSTSGMPSNEMLSAVLYCEPLSLFVVAGYYAIYTSTDAVAWTSHPTGVPGPVSVLKFDSDAQLLVARTDPGSILTSPDGVTWTTRYMLNGRHPALAISSAPPNTPQTIDSHTDVAVDLAPIAQYPAGPIASATVVPDVALSRVVGLLPVAAVSGTDVAVAFGLGVPKALTAAPVASTAELDDVDRVVLGPSILDVIESASDVALAGVQPGSLQPDVIVSASDIHIATEHDWTPDVLLGASAVAVDLASIGEFDILLDPISAAAAVRALYVPDLSGNDPMTLAMSLIGRLLVEDTA